MLHSPGYGVGSNTFDPYGSYARCTRVNPCMCAGFPSDEPCLVGADLDPPDAAPGISPYVRLSDNCRNGYVACDPRATHIQTSRVPLQMQARMPVGADHGPLDVARGLRATYLYAKSGMCSGCKRGRACSAPARALHPIACGVIFASSWVKYEWCPRQESNLRHLAPEASALSTELRGHVRAIMREKGLYAMMLLLASEPDPGCENDRNAAYREDELRAGCYCP